MPRGRRWTEAEDTAIGGEAHHRSKPMNGFDTHAAVTALRNARIEEGQAEARPS